MREHIQKRRSFSYLLNRTSEATLCLGLSRPEATILANDHQDLHQSGRKDLQRSATLSEQKTISFLESHEARVEPRSTISSPSPSPTVSLSRVLTQVHAQIPLIFSKDCLSESVADVVQYRSFPGLPPGRAPPKCKLALSTFPRTLSAKGLAVPHRVGRRLNWRPFKSTISQRTVFDDIKGTCCCWKCQYYNDKRSIFFCQSRSYIIGFDSPVCGSLHCK